MAEKGLNNRSLYYDTYLLITYEHSRKCKGLNQVTHRNRILILLVISAILCGLFHNKGHFLSKTLSSEPQLVQTKKIQIRLSCYWFGNMPCSEIRLFKWVNEVLKKFLYPVNRIPSLWRTFGHVPIICGTFNYLSPIHFFIFHKIWRHSHRFHVKKSLFQAYFCDLLPRGLDISDFTAQTFSISPMPNHTVGCLQRWLDKHLISQGQMKLARSCR